MFNLVTSIKFLFFNVFAVVGQPVDSFTEIIILLINNELQLLVNWTHPVANHAVQWQNLLHHHKNQNTKLYHLPDLFIYQSFRTVKEPNQLPLMKHVTIMQKVINFFATLVTE